MSGVLRPCGHLGPDIDGPVVGQWGGSPTLPVDMPHPPDGSYDPNSGESDRVNWAIRRGDLAALKFDGVEIFTDGM
ncbi:hypothetical protein [Micromonospora sp. NPDC005173]|uniref:hypothetical protein n=1 Tax=Micromonospora sp. NPDC005173 TaxID=3157165 RepID=UPI0033A049EA